jgi:hypothetical protein
MGRKTSTQKLTQMSANLLLKKLKLKYDVKKLKLWYLFLTKKVHFDLYSSINGKCKSKGCDEAFLFTNT